MNVRPQIHPWHRLSARALAVSSLMLLGCGEEQPTTTATTTQTSNAPSSDDDLIRANNRGVALMGYFDYDGARTQFEQLLAAHPTNHEIAVNLAIATLNRQQEGDEEAALAILESVLAQDPDHARAKYCAGLLNLNNGNSEVALAFFSQVAGEKPGDAFAQYYTGLCTLQSGDAEIAR